MSNVNRNNIQKSTHYQKENYEFIKVYQEVNGIKNFSEAVNQIIIHSQTNISKQENLVELIVSRLDKHDAKAEKNMDRLFGIVNRIIAIIASIYALVSGDVLSRKVFSPLNKKTETEEDRKEKMMCKSNQREIEHNFIKLANKRKPNTPVTEVKTWWE